MVYGCSNMNLSLNPKGSKSQIIGNRKYTMAVRKMIEIKFIQIPVLTISGILKYPDPNTTAFGGVATGSINAHEAATVVATSSI